GGHPPAMTWRNPCTTTTTPPAPRPGRAGSGPAPRLVSRRPPLSRVAGGAPPSPPGAGPRSPAPAPRSSWGSPTPAPGASPGTGGDFTVDLQARALNATGNNQLSAAHGYRPGLNLPPAATFGPGMPDPNAPGLVVTLSTTPRAAGGPNANLAGVFQLNSVSRHHGLTRVINDLELGV